MPTPESSIRRTASGQSSIRTLNNGDVNRQENGHALKDKCSATSGPPSKTKNPARSRFSTSGFLKLVAASAALGYFSWHYANSGATHLPDAYVLCSRQGRAIHSVDEQDQKVQCLAVNGTLIFDTGDLGDTSHSSSYLFV